MLVIGGILVVLVLGSTATAATFKIRHDHAVQARTAVAAAKKAETAQQIAARHTSERDMEATITKWVLKQVASGVLTGPILRTTCTPIGGGSENLAEITVKYDCLSITNENADGTSEGYPVHATMDFSDGSYTWGFGGA